MDGTDGISSAMDSSVNHEQQHIRELTREFAAAEIVPPDAEIDEKSRFDLNLYRKLGDLGFPGRLLPAEGAN